MTHPTTGRHYVDDEKTPVPFPSYRCRATATEPRPHAPHSTLTHACKVSSDHVDEHRCICGKKWAARNGAST